MPFFYILNRRNINKEVNVLPKTFDLHKHIANQHIIRNAKVLLLTKNATCIGGLGFV